MAASKRRNDQRIREGQPPPMFYKKNLKIFTKHPLDLQKKPNLKIFENSQQTT